MARVGALWIGGLVPYMDEAFLNQALINMCQDGVVSIKVMSNKVTGEPAGYGFINFESDQKAVYVMHRLGGKIIPNSNPPIRFKLNHNSTRLQHGEPDTSIWIGDLTPEVDDFALYQFFTQRYATVRCAKVVLDDSGFSKGYGFVRFGSEAEQQHSLANMTGEMGLGDKPIKVSLANQKGRMLADGSNYGAAEQHSQTNGLWGSMDGGIQVNPRNSWQMIDRSPAGWPPSGSNDASVGIHSVSAPCGPSIATATPELATYQQYYQQYAQQFSQQQQYATAWANWQHQQQP